MIGALPTTRGGPPPIDPLTAAIATMISASDAESLLLLIEGLAAEPFDPAIGRPRVPTLFVAGQEDPVAAADDLAGRLPDARVLRVPGDHFTAMAGPEFRTAVFEFLGVGA
ncbi:hypothetical protein D5S18_30000 [Nocardia panacis]|uniref:Alpha/beta hydrolase n=1 Tax=Nocardia panacis TaxID=2340916 RepID=A0A3A4JV09_9NOCA|nr:hypothetical protein [Nocardia panacis]RJO70085.1 hypothetical protein D5S18_30000 [Nocardia panacis]